MDRTDGLKTRGAVEGKSVRKEVWELVWRGRIKVAGSGERKRTNKEESHAAYCLTTETKLCTPYTYIH